jgi:hypothetical protein
MDFRGTICIVNLERSDFWFVIMHLRMDFIKCQIRVILKLERI